jgi:hypothetical protein
VGLFAEAAYGGVDGLFHGGGAGQLGTQFVGVIACFVLVFSASYVVFKIIDMTMGMRASDEDQLRGLDISEHEAAGYPDFAPALDPAFTPSGAAMGDMPPMATAPSGGAEDISVTGSHSEAKG